MIRNLAVVLACIMLIFLLLFAWPGVWRYTYYERGFVRLDRLTGKMYRRQIPRYNAIWATLEKDLQNQRERDPSLRPLTVEEMAKTKKSDRLKEVTAAMEQHVKLYHTNPFLDMLDNIAAQIDYDPFSAESKEAITFAFEKGYSVEEICSVRPIWCSLGIENTDWRWKGEAKEHPGRSSVHDYEQAFLHDWVPIQQ